jgi:hypothetical protein
MSYTVASSPSLNHEDLFTGRSGILSTLCRAWNKSVQAEINGALQLQLQLQLIERPPLGAANTPSIHQSRGTA